MLEYILRYGRKKLPFGKQHTAVVVLLVPLAIAAHVLWLLLLLLLSEHVAKVEELSHGRTDEEQQRSNDCLELHLASSSCGVFANGEDGNGPAQVTCLLVHIVNLRCQHRRKVGAAKCQDSRLSKDWKKSFDSFITSRYQPAQPTEPITTTATAAQNTAHHASHVHPRLRRQARLYFEEGRRQRSHQICTSGQVLA